MWFSWKKLKANCNKLNDNSTIQRPWSSQGSCNKGNYERDSHYTNHSLPEVKFEIVESQRIVLKFS